MRTPLGRSVLTATVVLAAAATLAAGGATAAPDHARAPAATGHWLRYDVKSKTATLTLVGAFNQTNNGFNFDGYAKGKMVVSVPARWKVVVHCSVSKKAAINHSCAITKKANATSPAFRGASSPKPTIGLKPGKSATFKFVPTKVGKYRIACLVPGHEPGGMWDVFRVTRSGKPSIKT